MNPYPTREKKVMIASIVGVESTSVFNWFMRHHSTRKTSRSLLQSLRRGNKPQLTQGILQSDVICAITIVTVSDM